MNDMNEGDPKARFRAALEKKNSKTNNSSEKKADSESSKLRASSGNKPKMFRRKSG